MNPIFLRRRGKLHLKPGSGGTTLEEAAMLQRQIEPLGFVMSEALVERLLTQSPEELGRVLRFLRQELPALTGAHRVHRPLLPDFPNGPLARDEAKSYFIAIWHYITRSRLPPDESARPLLLRGRAPRVIELGTREEFEAIFTQLAASPVSLSAQDKEDLAWFVAQYRDGVARLLPTRMTHKENIAVVAAALVRGASGAAAGAFVSEHVTTATDALRFAVALCGGDVSLAVPTRFQRFVRAERRMLLGIVENASNAIEDMRRFPERWKRLGERLHPGDHAERFPRAWQAFLAVRGNLPFDGYNAMVERALRDGDIDAATDRLAQRPGELARRLDHLLRSGAQPERVLASYADVAGRIATPLLLQVLAHFTHRGEAELRTFFPKGDAARAWAIPETRDALPDGVAARAASICRDALRERFAQRPPLGRCHVDPALAQSVVPLAQRSASRALRTLVRGSRLPLPDTRYIRLFLWWKNGSHRTDIDLSAAFYDVHYTHQKTVAYYNLHDAGGHHSGDIVDAPQGASEFIDLDLERLRADGIRFVVTAIMSFTEQPYCDLPECFAGWMARSDLDSGEVFEARTVEDRLDIASNTRTCLPFVLDLHAREIIWTDIGLNGSPRWNNVRNNLSGISLMLRAMVSMPRPDLRTLFDLHAQARGVPVESRLGADTVFSGTAPATVGPLDTDRIRAEFL